MKGNNANGNITVVITIDKNGSLITDTGEQRKIAGSWWQSKEFILPRDTKSVVIKADNLDKKIFGGIVASLESSELNIVTDGSWECANLDLCKARNCTECKWQNATTYGYINNRTFHKYDKINRIQESAQWIWVNSTFVQRVWCKKTFGE